MLRGMKKPGRAKMSRKIYDDVVRMKADLNKHQPGYVLKPVNALPSCVGVWRRAYEVSFTVDSIRAAACIPRQGTIDSTHTGITCRRNASKQPAVMNNWEIFQLAKGFRGRAKNCIRISRERVEKALQYAYRDRRNKKRDMRGLWIQRINAGARQHGVNYGQFMHGLNTENVQLNRKVLSEIAMHEPYSFKTLVDVSRSAFQHQHAHLKK